MIDWFHIPRNKNTVNRTAVTLCKYSCGACYSLQPRDMTVTDQLALTRARFIPSSVFHKTAGGAVTKKLSKASKFVNRKDNVMPKIKPYI